MIIKMKNKELEDCLKEIREYEKNGKMMSYSLYTKVSDSINKIVII
jgi:hypothetical protein